MLKSLQEIVHRQEAQGDPSVLVVSGEIRQWLARWLRASLPGLHVLAFTEIPENRRVKVVATVGREAGNRMLEHEVDGVSEEGVGT